MEHVRKHISVSRKTYGPLLLCYYPLIYMFPSLNHFDASYRKMFRFLIFTTIHERFSHAIVDLFLKVFAKTKSICKNIGFLLQVKWFAGFLCMLRWNRVHYPAFPRFILRALHTHLLTNFLCTGQVMHNQNGTSICLYNTYVWDTHIMHYAFVLILWTYRLHLYFRVPACLHLSDCCPSFHIFRQRVLCDCGVNGFDKTYVAL